MSESNTETGTVVMSVELPEGDLKTYKNNFAANIIYTSAASNTVVLHVETQSKTGEYL